MVYQTKYKDYGNAEDIMRKICIPVCGVVVQLPSRTQRSLHLQVNRFHLLESKLPFCLENFLIHLNDKKILKYELHNEIINELPRRWNGRQRSSPRKENQHSKEVISLLYNS